MSIKKHILVVEDDAALVRVLKDNLVFEGFEVECVGDDALVLNKAKSFVPDLVVLDVTLPGINGFDLCGTLRQRGRTPILILSARGQTRGRTRGSIPQGVWAYDQPQSLRLRVQMTTRYWGNA